MFDATKKALDRTIEDFLFADFLRIVVSSLVYTATLLYRIVLGKLLWLYLPLLAITAIYLTEYLCFTKYGANLKMTGAKKKALCWYRLPAFCSVHEVSASCPVQNRFLPHKNLSLLFHRVQ